MKNGMSRDDVWDLGRYWMKLLMGYKEPPAPKPQKELDREYEEHLQQMERQMASLRVQAGDGGWATH